MDLRQHTCSGCPMRTCLKRPREGAWDGQRWGTEAGAGCCPAERKGAWLGHSRLGYNPGWQGGVVSNLAAVCVSAEMCTLVDRGLGRGSGMHLAHFP